MRLPYPASSVVLRKIYTRQTCLIRGQCSSAKPDSRLNRSEYWRNSRAYSTEVFKDTDPSAVIFSGIQPTGVPHLGNYLGALREWVRIQNSPPGVQKLIFSIVDLHALTVPQNPSDLRRQRNETLAILLAIGLDPNKSILFHQSAVPAHTELMWILSTVASVGYLSRMTQWKSKLHLPADTDLVEASNKSALRLGLFSYPILQAADILVHRATHVPVGNDQKQHIEFTRYTAKSFNHLYGDIFPIPEALLSPTRRLMSLKEPRSKMSKSDADPRSRILLTDSREDIERKIRLALTDSEPSVTYDPERRPGVSNLLDILSGFDHDHRSADDLAVDFKYCSMKAFKEHVAATVTDHLRDIRDTYVDIMENRHQQLESVAAVGAQRARAHADCTIHSVKNSLGL